LVLDAAAPLSVAIEGVHRQKMGPNLLCNIGGCDASYTTKYNLLRHLRAHHNGTMELSKPRFPSTWEQGLKVQDHTTMNAQVLNNPLAQFRHNEQKVIARAKRHAFLEWDRL